MARRQFLQIPMAGAVAVSLGVPGAAVSEGPVAENDGETPTGDEDALDAVLRLLQRHEPDCRGGLSSHAPMVAEALTSLGHGAGAVEWVERHSGSSERLPSKVARIEESQWRAALGPDLANRNWTAANTRWADWKEFFHEQLSEAPWESVLDLWVGRLAPGLSGAATHGIIRTSHAVRSLHRRDSRERRGELARALAYWASSYEELPTGSSTSLAPGARTVKQALTEVPLYWRAFKAAPAGRNIVEQLRHLKDVPGFENVRGLIGEPEDPLAALSAMNAQFARVYLRHGSRHHTIAFVHAITGPTALRKLAPHIKPGTARRAFIHAWHAAAAIYSAYARPEDEPISERVNRTPDELVAGAVKNGDDHAIKITEVLMGEYALNPDPAFLAAAANAIERL